MITDIPELLTEAQAADRIGVSADTLARERKAGRISYQPLGRRAVRYRAQHIAKYLDLLEVEAQCKKNDSSSESSGSQSEKTHRFGVSPGSTSRRAKPIDLQRASEILNGRRSN